MTPDSEIVLRPSSKGAASPEKRGALNLATVAEAPRYSCSLGGAYMCTLATFGSVPILHSGPGCVLAQNFGQNFAAGLNGAGPHGNTSSPCSCLVDEHVVFGGEDKLRTLIASTIEVVKGNLFVVISGCVPALIGDDVGGVVSGFRSGKHPVIHVNTAGFLGNSYHGYHAFFGAVIDQLLTPRPRQTGLVNLLGVVPYQHVFWKGNLTTIKNLLERLGLEVNIIFTEDNGLEALRKIPAAELNLVLSPWCGVGTAQSLETKFGTPYLQLPTVPVGPKDTSQFLRLVSERLGLEKSRVEALIQEEEHKTYRFMEYAADMVMIALPHAYAALVGDASTVIGLTRYVSNELSWLPEVVVVTDDPPEESRKAIERYLTEDLESVVKPTVIFEHDSHKIRLQLRKHSVQIVLASSLEKHIATDELEAMQLSVSFPIYDRLIVDRTYAGYRGGIALMEDVAAKYGGPL